MILDTIVAHKKEEVARLQRLGVGRPAGPVDPPRGFQHAITSHPAVAIIAEAKKASPSKGLLCADFDPVQIARQYQQGGASAMSVLTDERFFQGSLSYLVQVRATVDLPVLRKDFIIHELQIEEASRFGADAILLIAAILGQSRIRDYLAMATELGMDMLVEVHDEAELESALAAGSRLIGVNNRNLRDFTVDLETTFRLKRLIPAGIPVVSESGIRTRSDILRLAAEGVAAALIGEALVKEPDPAAALKALLGN